MPADASGAGGTGAPDNPWSDEPGPIWEPPSDPLAAIAATAPETPASALRAKAVSEVSPDETEHRNVTHVVTFEDESQAVYKPAEGERPGNFRDIPDTEMWLREVAVGYVDSLLHFDLVPTTSEWSGRYGIGSLQEWRDAHPGHLDIDSYDRIDVERMAVLDYICGNTDRHSGNYLTDPETGRPVAIDHGRAFPEFADAPIRSEFIARCLNQTLSDEVVAAVRAVDVSIFRAVLNASGLGAGAVDGAVARLTEVQQLGRIDGSGWPGQIMDANQVVVR